MNNKILLTGLVLASLASTSMAAGINNTVNPNAAGYGAESYGKSNTINATGTSSFAVGFENTVSGANSLVYGHNNKATGANSFAGGENSEAKGYSSLAIGSSAQALSDYTFAIGSQARTNGNNTVAVGNGAYASNTNALAVGYGTAASGKDSLAFGSFVKSNSDNNVAIGTSVTTNSNDSVGIGTSVTTKSNNSVGIGNNVVNNLSNSIGIGNGVATDFNTIGIGNGVETKVQDTIAIGNGVVSNGESSVAIGNGIHAEGVKTVNIGTNVNAKGVSSIVVGRDTTVNGDDTTVVGANNGTIDADQAAVYGYNNVVQDASKEQLIFGVNSTTKEQGSTVVGSHSKATAVDSLALGNNTIADVQNGVAIGTNSVTESPVGTTNIKDNTTDIRFSNSTYAGSNPDSVVSFGTNGRAGAGGVTEYTRQLQNLAAGRVSATSTDGINGSQLYDVALEAQKHNTLVDGTNTTVTSQDNAFGRKEYKVNVNRDLTNMNSVQFNTVNDPQRNFVSKDGIHVFNGEVNTNYGSNGIKLENTNNLDTAEYNMDGININSNGKNVRFGTDGINAGDQIINNVKAGVADTDAVNVSQLKGVQSNVANNTSRINNLGQKVNTNANDIRAVEHTILDHKGRITVLENGVKDLDNKINSTAGNVLNQSKSYTDNQAAKVGANAAALSALHPLDFNADEKWQFSVGFGNYKGKNATALGAFYQPNENVLLSVGTTLGTGENMINAGATVRFGSHSSMTTNKQVAVAKEVQDLKLQLSAISQKYDNLVKNLSAQKAGQDVDFEYSDLPKDHWAYDFVKKLSDKGYLNGYPDGTFKGDTKMTRYEFAAALWRAVNNGAIIDAQMAKAIKEFEPELEEVNKIMRYRIDTVAGKDNSVYKTERLRVNKNDDPFTHMKRDDYGTKTYTNK
jgi:hep/hag repeat protein